MTMQYRKVGKTGLKVSSISIGGWITVGGSVDDTVAHKILSVAAENGVNFVDLADVYARGESERVAGTWLKEKTRSDFVVSSKVFWPMSDNPNDRGLSRKHIFESVHGSLKRLQTDYLDIYFCHRFDEETPLEETVRAMDDLIRQGKILYWGTSCWTPEQLREAHSIANSLNAYAPIVEQPRYNLIDRSIEGGVIGTARELGMGLVVWSPLAQGLLAGRYNDGVPEDSRAATTSWLSDSLTDENLDRCRKFTTLAQDSGVRPEQLALAWTLRTAEVSSAITGASRPEQLIESVKAASLTLEEGVWSEVESIFSA